MSDALTRTTVPFVDLGPVNAEVRDEVLQGLAELVDTGAFVNGAAVLEFERAFAGWVGTREAVGVASGLDALRLALAAGGLAPGDEVLVPANTFVATLEAVTQAGGVPVPVDVSERDYNLDPAAAEAAVGPRTRALVPVHLYGQLADMRALAAVAERHALLIVEDACQAHGAERDGIRAGTAGTAAAFSFYPAKNLGAFGDAGAATTDDAELARRIRILREHGQTAKYEHAFEGWTARLDTLQAIVLAAKLPRLAYWTDRRRDAAAYYLDALDGVGDLGLPPVPAGSSPVWHLFVVRTAAPDALAAHLAERGVATGRHYPVPAHLSPAYEFLGLSSGALPVAERLAAEVISLPFYAGVTEAQLEYVCDCVREYFAGG